ncbi:GDP-fucose transporter 1 isoform X2 [Pectinophora gossypiella]|uniref:GDP-fucose transporter 1 isoform X2 n=1 Tax=Pectinophora gossypiella TaxID=13191 RepID=UPI00214F202B|nr:GDP-fucose transporter 1 isoform X2 [Pectinophora gossypiella]
MLNIHRRGFPHYLFRYRVVSIATVFVNKTLLSGQEVALEAPLFITWFQCIVSFVICFTLSHTGGIPCVFVFPKGSPWNYDVVRKVIPLSLMFTLMIATNNLCLKYVGVSFYYIGRSLTTVFNVAFSWILLGQTTSMRCILCCLFIIFGFYLGVDQENLLGSFSFTGTVYGVIGSLMLSLYSIYTKKVLPSVNQEVWLLSYYNNAYSIILFLPLIAMNGELEALVNYKQFDSSYFWIQMVIGGVCGFAIGFFTSLQIKVTSPLTHNISGTAKACAQTVMATQWYNESKNLLWWTSNIIVLSSSALYARFKQIEMDRNSRKTVPEETKSLAAEAEVGPKLQIDALENEKTISESLRYINNNDTPTGN